MATSEPVLEVDRSEIFTNGLLLNLWDMKTRGESTDMTIIAANIPIRCHSVVMAAASEHFRELLKGPMKEATKREIELNFDHAHVQKVVEYCYTGRIKVEVAKTKTYLRITDYFHLTKLKSKIEQFMCEHLLPETCIGWYSTAEEFGLCALETKCRDFMAANLTRMSEDAEFLQLGLRELKDCIKCVADPNISLDACCTWATSNTLSRSNDFLGLLMEIHLDKCSPKCVDKVLQTWKPIWPNYAEVQKALKPFASVVLRASAKLPTYPAKPRKLTMLLFGGRTQTNILNRKLWKIDLRADSCELFGTMDHRAVKYDAGYCSTPEKLFVIGGSRAWRDDKYQPLSECYALSLRDSKWEAWPNMNEPLADMTVVYVKDRLYTFGGDSNDKAVYRFNLKTKWWSRCPDMPVDDKRPIIGIGGNKVYWVLQTDLESEACKGKQQVIMYCFDTCTLTWTPPMPLPADFPDTCSAQAVSVGEDFYLVGGRSRICVRYITQQDTWRILERPRVKRQIFAAVHMDGEIVVCGGCDGQHQVHDTIEVYNIALNAWRVHSLRMPIGLEFPNTAVFDDEARRIVT